MLKVLWFRFKKSLDLFTMLLFEGCSETGLFRHLSNHCFLSLQFPKYISYEGHLFFQNVQNLIFISKMQKKIEKIFFLLEIIASELVALNSLY